MAELHTEEIIYTPININHNMKKLTFCLAALFCCVLMQANPQYTKADSLKVMSLLKEAQRLPAGTNLMLHFARKLTGIPYVAHTLEVNKEERLVVNISQLDCTTYVENVLTLAWCAKHHLYSFDGYCKTLREVRYIGGLIGYTSRQHYFTTWIEDNTRDGFVREVQLPDPPFSAVQTIRVDYMTTHPQAYKMLREHPQWLPYIRQQEEYISNKQYRFIPKGKTGDNAMMRKAVCDGDIIAIVTNASGLDIAHVGVAVWHADGLHLLNASMARKKVVDEPMTLYQYLQRHKTHAGIRIVRPQL